jgi:hypothetical protein
MKIIRFDKHLLKNEEWFEFYTRYEEMIETYGDFAMGISELFELLVPILRQADKALQVLRKSYYTEPLAEADKKRGDVFRGFEGVVKSMTLLPDTSMKEMAKYLHNLIEGYRKNILKGNYREESAAIYNLLQDLNGKYEVEVDKLGLYQWVESLEDAEKEFKVINKKREDESRDKPKDDLIKYRRQADLFYTSIASVIDARLVAEGLGGDIVVDPKSLDKEDHENLIVWDPEKYGNMTYNFAVAWNEVVKKYRDDLARRIAIRKKGDNDPDPEEE